MQVWGAGFFFGIFCLSQNITSWIKSFNTSSFSASYMMLSCGILMVRRWDVYIFNMLESQLNQKRTTIKYRNAENSAKMCKDISKKTSHQILRGLLVRPKTINLRAAGWAAMRLSKVASCLDKMLSDSKSSQQAFSASPENGENSWQEMKNHWENQACTKIASRKRIQKALLVCCVWRSKQIEVFYIYNPKRNHV